MRKIIFSKYSIILFGFSLFFSLFFLISKIDQDFFTFLYIGRGLSKGFLMFKDFADNKGPVLDLFFWFLYFLFKENYLLSIIVSSTLIDWLAVLFAIKSSEIILNKDKLIDIENKKSLFLLFVLVGLYKSFNLGQMGGGLYSESLGMLFVFISIYCVLTKRNFFSGIFLSLALLSRLTLIFYAIFLFTSSFGNFLKIEENFFVKLKRFLSLIFGVLLVIVLFGFYFWKSDILVDFLNTTIFSNLNYGGSVSLINKFAYFIYTAIYQIRILILTFIVLVVSILIVVKFNINNRLNYIFMFISSFLATFSGGIFFYHHFIQFTPIIFLVLFCCLYMDKAKRRTMLVYLLSALVFVNYVCAIFNKDKFDDLSLLMSQINHEYKNFTYWQIVPYYPEYYIFNEKYSPDKYFITFFISRYFTVDPSKESEVHKKITEEKLCKTLFVFINQNKFDYLVSEDYLNSFKDKFRLVQIKSYVQRNTTVNLYESNCFSK